jgi:hypothetical protein
MSEPGVFEESSMSNKQELDTKPTEFSGNEPTPITVNTPHGSMQVEVLDGFSDKPLEGVTIIIPETKEVYRTDATGKTPLMTLPVLEDSTYKKIFPKTWGEVTIIAVKDGYVPYLLFHTQVWENQTRKGPRILLFQKGSTSSDEPFSIVEGPQRLWVNQLLEKSLSALNP